MSVNPRSDAATRHANVDRFVLIGGLLATRLGDVLVTYYGLQVGLVEANPIARAAMDAVGVLPALVGVSASVLVLIVATGEWAVWRVPVPAPRRSRVRALLYGGPTLVWIGVCVHNLSLVAAVT
jgi:hypothetical protein